MELYMLVVSTVNPQQEYFCLPNVREVETRTSDPWALVEHGAVTGSASLGCITNYVDLIPFHNLYSQESRVRKNCSIS